MKVLHDIAELRRATASTGPLALVPTMGNLHDGHLSLVRLGKKVSSNVVVSIFVNRLQFLPGEDFASYPRTFERDIALLEKEGVALVFAPDEKVLYPVPQAVMVKPPPVGEDLEGRFRAGFFQGVCTVVLKLFNAVQPAVAVFGKKDYQQLVVVREMVRQLNLPLEIVAGETVRETDGLAMSSRNGYLSKAERAEAPRLHRVLQDVASGKTTADRAMTLLSEAGWKPDYVEVRRRADLAPPQNGEGARVVLAAARLGTTRLIDNLEF
jgi:pantoate--beta-alanine ligase